MTEAQQKRVAPWIATALLFLMWEVGVRWSGIQEFILPAPSAAIAALFEYAYPIAFHSWSTLWITLVGFAIAVVFGLVPGKSLIRDLPKAIIGFAFRFIMTLRKTIGCLRWVM